MPMPPENPRRLKPWLRAMLFLALMFGLLSGLSRVFDYAAKQDLREKARWVISQRNESCDFAILGSSRSYVGIHIPTLERTLGHQGINLSLDGTTYPEQYLALKLFLAHNQIKHLVLDVNVFGFDQAAFKYPFRAYEYLPWIDDPVVFDSLRDYFGWRAYAWKYVPFFRQAEFNSKIGVIQCYTLIKSRFDPRIKEAEFDAHGSRLIDRAFDEASLANYPKVTWKIEPAAQTYFLRLLELARSHHVNVTMILVPEYFPAVERQTNRREIIDYYATVAASNNIPFLRFDQDGFCRAKSKYYNVNHLNRTGAMEFSACLAERLATKNIPVTDSN